jgi:hypothetical protein
MRFASVIDKAKQVLSVVISFMIPFVTYYKANKKVLARIQRIDDDKALSDDFQYVGSNEGHKLETIQVYFDKTIESKKSLEEKSRAILLSITVATSLIFGLLTIVLGQSFATFNSGVRWFIVILGSLSIVYMVSGAWLALRVLSGRIQIYQLYPDEEKTINETEKCKNLAVLTEQNSNMNIIRGNNIYTCYISTINSLILLCILFISLSVSSVFGHNTEDSKATDLGQVITQIKHSQSSLESIYSNIVSIKNAREEEKSQLRSAFAESIDKIKKIGEELEDLKRKNAEYQALIDKAKNHQRRKP